MNVYGLIILITIFVEYVTELVSDILNIKHLKPELPEGFEDVYSEEEYSRSQNYTRENTRFGLIDGTFDLVLLLLFWFLGGFNYLDNFIRSFGLNSMVTGVIFVTALLLLKQIVSFPFDLYDTFVLEEKYGFNKTTLKTYILDILKSLLLYLALGVPIFFAVLAFFEYTGKFAWLYCFLFTTLVSLFIQYLAPILILPIFNKFTPLEDGELKQAIMDYADKTKFPIKGIFVMDGSKRSAKSNAFFTGFGKNKRIVLFDTLIAKHTVAELVAVLAHEIGHYKRGHIIKGMILGIVHSFILFYILSLFITQKALFDAFYMDDTSVYAGLIFFGMLYAPVEFFLSLLLNWYSRKNEYEADRFASETITEPQAMVTALKKLSAHNLSNLTPHPLNVFLHYSHPPLIERVAAINAAGVKKEV